MERDSSTVDPIELSSLWGPTDDYDDESGAPCSDGAQRLGQTLLPMLYSLVFVLGLLGNGLALLVLVRRQRRVTGGDTGNATQVFLLNLAAADLLFVATLPLWACQAARGWLFGEWACKLATALYSVSFFCGVFLLTCLSVDRYLVVVRATRCRGASWRRRRAWVACVGAWSVAALLSLLDVLSSHAQPHVDGGGGPGSAPHVVCQSLHAGPGGHVRRAVFTVFQTAACFLLPFGVMLACYARIAVTLSRSKSRGSRRKAVRVIVAIVLLFFVCWLPYNAVLLAVALADLYGAWLGCGAHEALNYARQATETLGFAHCCLNPILYAFAGVRFRADLYRTLRDARSALCRSLPGGWAARRAAAAEPGKGSRSVVPSHSGEAPLGGRHPEHDDDARVAAGTLRDLDGSEPRADSSHVFSGVSAHSWVFSNSGPVALSSRKS